jgi:anhydro-N-acetylmuramic acid kinase
MAETYNVIGIMSGTSLDGIDIAFIEFKLKKGIWKFRLLAAETNSYTVPWKARLQKLQDANAFNYAMTDVDLGILIGGQIRSFIKKNRISPDLIASHGHTIFHQPAKVITTQIGNGAVIAALTGIPTVCDFRMGDVAKKGQGAPLVPLGDRLLFGDYDYCLNLGGIANISFEQKGKRVASDICIANMALNFLAMKEGKAYDKDGKMAGRGKVNQQLLAKLNAPAFFKKPFPKSLGAEWFSQYCMPLLEGSKISLADRQATMVEHIVQQVGSVLVKSHPRKKSRMLVTGGGAFHKFLIKIMQDSLPVIVEVPDATIVSFKEAIIFGLLGVLRWRNEINVLASVTGATGDSSSGALYNP